MASLFINHGINYTIIVDRIKDEAETVEDMATLVNGEILAYSHLIDTRNPYCVNMWDKAIINGDQVLVGELYDTEEDFDDDYCGYITPKNYMKKGELHTEYELIWKLQS